MAAFSNYYISLEILEPKIKYQAVKLAKELIKRNLYPEHTAVPLAVNAIKNWVRNGWL